jgi:hypothetical protein
LDQDGPEVALSADELGLDVREDVRRRHPEEDIDRRGGGNGAFLVLSHDKNILAKEHTKNYSYEDKDKKYTYIHAERLHEGPAGPASCGKAVHLYVVLGSDEVLEPRDTTQGGRRRARASGSGSGGGHAGAAAGDST